MTDWVKLHLTANDYKKAENYTVAVPVTDIRMLEAIDRGSCWVEFYKDIHGSMLHQVEGSVDDVMQIIKEAQSKNKGPERPLEGKKWAEPETE